MRYLKRSTLAVAAPVLLVFLSSCGATLDEYKRFAEAGKEYAAAMDSLLISSADAFIGSSSESLLAADEQNPANDQLKYVRSKETLEAYLRLIALARQHTVLLSKYFRALEDLASSDAPQKAQETSARIFAQLTDIGGQIMAMPAITANSRDAFSKIPALIVSAKIKGALRSELMARKEAIYKELVTQELAQKLLSRQIRSDLASINNYKENRTIRPAYLSSRPIDDPSKWISLRAEISKASLSSQALDDAAQTSKDLKEAFQDLLSDKLTVARASALVDSIRELAEIAKGLRESGSQN